MLTLLFILLITSGIYLVFFNKTTAGIRQISLKIGGKSFSLEIASTIWQQTKGLSGRTDLCGNCGMLFVFPASQIQTFWMKGTLIPLDMIFLDPYGKIVTIHTAYPEPKIPPNKLKTYSSSENSQYVIELNAGQAKLLNLKIGQTLPLPLTL